MAKVEFSRSKGVLEVLFDSSVPVYSPVVGDLERVVSHDEEGREIVSFRPVDYAELNKMLGFVEVWSLEAMVKAGINPAFPVHTSNSVSRLEGVGTLEGVAAQVNDAFENIEKEA